MAQESFLEAAALKDGRIQAKTQIKAQACWEAPSAWKGGGGFCRRMSSCKRTRSKRQGREDVRLRGGLDSTLWRGKRLFKRSVKRKVTPGSGVAEWGLGQTTGGQGGFPANRKMPLDKLE